MKTPLKWEILRAPTALELPFRQGFVGEIYVVHVYFAHLFMDLVVAVLAGADTGVQN